MPDSSEEDQRNTGTQGTDADREAIAEAFGQSLDPLAQNADQFKEIDADSFEIFIQRVLEPKDRDETTIRKFRYVFSEWKEHMASENRHPACPNEAHVRRYIEWVLTDESDPRPHGRPNKPKTAKEKLRKLNQWYRYCQRDSVFPHPTNYNPFEIACETVNLNEPRKKEQHKIPPDEMRSILADVTHWRKRAIIGTQLKLGLRAGEMVNIRLEDFSIRKREVARHFDDLGTNPVLDGRENAIYIPPSDERDGNKSERPRVLPLDDELQRVLLRYLLVRPDNGEPWLFLSTKSHSQLTPKRINEVWKEVFRPEYDETDRYKPLTSHYGRHWFTTYWRIEENVHEEYVKYMRGDKQGKSFTKRSAMHAYLHTYYDDIEDLYRERIYKLHL